MSQKETDLASLVIKYFENLGYTTYKEVSIRGGGSARADIIAVKGDDHIVIETKTSFGLKVIEQAFFWKDKSHKTFVAIPKGKNRHFGYSICVDMGIGVIEIDKYNNVGVIIESSICNDPKLPQLYEQQRGSIAGNDKSEFVTPFKITCKTIQDYMEIHKESQLNDLVSNIKHHYRNDGSAKNALSKLIKMGVLDSLSIVKRGNKLIVYRVV